MKLRAVAAAPLALLLTILLAGNALASWRGPVLVDDELPTCSSLIMADFFGIGRGTYLQASGETGILHAIHASEQGVFATYELDTGLDGVRTALVGDINSDGDKDILVAAADGGIYWYGVNFSSSSLTDPVTVAGIHSSISDLSFADFDGDGDTDIIASEPDSARVLLFRQQPGGGFLRSTVLNNLPGVDDISVGRIDPDSSPDIVAVSPDQGDVVVLMNDGDAGFTSTVLADNHSGTTKVFVFNVDNDLDSDVITLRPDRITVFRHSNTGWLPPVETVGPITGANDLTLRDVNNNGFPEIYVSDPELGGIVQFNPLGDALYAAEAVNLATDGVTHLTMGNSLGVDTPEISVMRDSGQIVLFSAVPVVSFTGEPLSNVVTAPTALLEIDLDLDGDLDFLSNSRADDEIVWWVNDGEGGFDQTIVVMEIPNPSRVAAGDMDNDGDLDLLATSDQIGAAGIAVQDTLGGFDASVLANVSAAKGIDIGDLNGDALPDFAVSGYDHIHIFMNQGELTFDQSTLPTAVNGPSDLEIADMDLDGDNDIVYVAFNLNRVLLEENVGTTFVHHELGVVPDAHWLDLGDINGDGYPDVLTTSNVEDALFWLENSGTAGAYTVYEVDDGLPNADQSVIVDMDNDGDSDLIAGGFDGGRIDWWENNGFQEWTRHELVSEYSNPSGIIAGDFDHNGPTDVITASFGGDGIIFWHSSASADAVVLTLTPFSPPIDVPPFGGWFYYHAQIENQRLMPVDSQIFLEVEFPGGYVHEVASFPLSLGSFGVISRQYVGQYIPGILPAGTYTYRVAFGESSDMPIAEAEFIFTKADWLDTADDGWSISGWDGSGVHPFTGTPRKVADGGDRPVSFQLGEAWPNPFNSTTAVTVSLQHPAEMIVTVHNTLGQRVATLADGRWAAGEHTLSFQADHLASGVYFVQAQLAGHSPQTRKLLLVR